MSQKCNKNNDKNNNKKCQQIKQIIEYLRNKIGGQQKKQRKGHTQGLYP